MKTISVQPMRGAIIQGWVVISDEPTRTVKGLTWLCRCAAGMHSFEVLHHDLTYSAVPTCHQCVKEDQEQAAAQKVKARRVLAECLADARKSRIAQHKIAQQDQQENQDV